MPPSKPWMPSWNWLADMQNRRKLGRDDLADMLDRPALPPRTFREALAVVAAVPRSRLAGRQSPRRAGAFRPVHVAIAEIRPGCRRSENSRGGRCWLAEFFISLNKDSDLYPGVQQGDNGQTLTLGGVKPEGSHVVNELTHMVLRIWRVSEAIIDKINLRISPDTDLVLLSLATDLTRKGLGSPNTATTSWSYRRWLRTDTSWKMLVIMSLLPAGNSSFPAQHGSANIGAVSFPAAVHQAIRSGLQTERIWKSTYGHRDKHTQPGAVMADAYENVLLPPAPYYSVTSVIASSRDMIPRKADLQQSRHPWRFLGERR